MKIKSVNDFCLEISTDEVVVVTDPNFGQKYGIKLLKTECDVILNSQKDLENQVEADGISEKLTPKKRESIFSINGSGEYEIAQLLIQRPINSGYYVIDSGYGRVVYLGIDYNKYENKGIFDCGNVDCLIVPVGGDQFIPYEKLQEIINEIEPSVLLPYGYKTENMKDANDLKTKDDFVKHFGYSNFTTEKVIKVSQSADGEESAMKITFVE